MADVVHYSDAKPIPTVDTAERVKLANGLATTLVVTAASSPRDLAVARARTTCLKTGAAKPNGLGRASEIPIDIATVRITPTNLLAAWYIVASPRRVRRFAITGEFVAGCEAVIRAAEDIEKSIALIALPASDANP